MNKCVKNSIWALSLLSVSVGGLVMYRLSELTHKKTEFQQSLASFERNLPLGFSITQESQPGFLSTNGAYIITFSNPQNGITDSLIIDYNISHGFNYWLTGKVNSTLEGKIDGASSKYLNTSNFDNLFVGNLSIDNSDNLDLDLDFHDIKFNDVDNSELNNVKYVLNYNKSTDYLKSKLSINNAILKIQNTSLMFNDISLDYNTGSDPFKGSEIFFNINKIEGKDILFNKILMSGELINNKQTIDLKYQFKIDNFNFPNYPNNNLNFKFGFYNFDTNATKYILNSYSRFKKPEDFGKNIEILKNKVRQIFQNGFVIKIDEFNIHDKDNNMESRLNLEVVKAGLGNDINLTENLKLNSTITLSGKKLPFYYQLFNQGIGGEDITDFKNLKDYSWNILIDNAKVSVNGKYLEANVQNSLKNFLTSFDYFFKKELL